MIVMRGVLSTTGSFFSLCFLANAAVLRHRQPPVVQITWFTEYETAVDEVTYFTTTSLMTVEPPKVTPYYAEGVLERLDTSSDPFLVAPPESDNTTVEISGVTVSMPVVTSVISRTFTETLYDGPKTVTVLIPPTTVTDIVTVSTAAPTNYWSLPEHYTDLDPFKITHFADGSSNVMLTEDVTDADLDSANTTSMISSGFNSLTPVNASFGSIVQVFFPAGSVNPGNEPVGGADFYASPLNLDGANSVTLEYSVFFPSGFQWVKGGKLPGLYGGHMTCSGGDDATSCFSTRLMWRENGAGELYLYAPKNEQTEALCKTPPFSYCDEDYGLSIGRGSFNYTPGAWTTLRQTVTLNTPGQQDGAFLLEVDGKLVIHRNDIFYRSAPKKSAFSETTASTSSIANGGLLGPLLGDVLRRVGLDNKAYATAELSEDCYPFVSLGITSPCSVATVTKTTDAPDVTITSYVFENAKNELPNLNMDLQSTPSAAVGFSGLFFSTFFGGSSVDYATPVDQFVWFRSFSMVINL